MTTPSRGRAVVLAPAPWYRRPAEQQDRSGGHFGRDGLGRVGLARRAQVAAGDDAGGAVIGGEVVERPQRGDHDVAVAGQRVDALVVVEDLGLLAGMDLDGAGDAELRAGADRLLDRVQDEGGQCGLVQAACHGERGPGPLGPGAVEAGSPLGDLKQRAELRPGRGHGLLAQQPGDDGVAAALKLPYDRARVRHTGIIDGWCPARLDAPRAYGGGPGPRRRVVPGP